jgi:hypothetical protein
MFFKFGVFILGASAIGYGFAALLGTGPLMQRCGGSCWLAGIALTFFDERGARIVVASVWVVLGLAFWYQLWKPFKRDE